MRLGNWRAIWNVKITWIKLEKQNVVICHVLKPKTVKTCFWNKSEFSLARSPATCRTSEKLTLFGDNTDFSLVMRRLYFLTFVMPAGQHAHMDSIRFPLFFLSSFSHLSVCVACHLPLPSNVGIGKRSHLLAWIQHGGAWWAPQGLKEIMPGSQPLGSSWARFPQSIKRKTPSSFQIEFTRKPPTGTEYLFHTKNVHLFSTFINVF